MRRIQAFVDRRGFDSAAPIAAFGKLRLAIGKMLEWTTSLPGRPPGDCSSAMTTPRGGGLRPPGSPVGKLDLALDQARERGWTVSEYMRNDWARVLFPDPEARRPPSPA